MTYEKPQVKKFESKEEAYVFEQFHRVNFEIEKIPELYERLVELNTMPDSHFEDAVTMAKIVDYLWDEIKTEKDVLLTKNELKLACLFHDVGKSGPANADHRQRYLIETLFNPKLFNPKSEKFKGKSPRDLTIDEALDLENMPEKDELKEYLNTLTLNIYNPGREEAKEEKLDLKKHKLIGLWREHDSWTRDLLRKNKNKLIKEEIITVASNHHALDGRKPVKEKGKKKNKNLISESTAVEVIDKYQILTNLLDKYQAWVDRSGLPHNEAIEKIKEYIEDSKNKKIINHNNETYNKFIKFLGIFKKHPEIAEII